ncbi:MAG: hypothetical protein HQK78_07310 [Desulfobacterales bacterium]|nr:hypothetical protein [Desulfobacterales bacterium]
MIEIVKADGLKGLPKFEQPLKRLNLFIGKNGAGKSARSDALKLAVLADVSEKNCDKILLTICIDNKNNQ